MTHIEQLEIQLLIKDYLNKNTNLNLDYIFNKLALFKPMDLKTQ